MWNLSILSIACWAVVLGVMLAEEMRGPLISTRGLGNRKPDSPENLTKCQDARRRVTAQMGLEPLELQGSSICVSCKDQSE